MIMLSNSAVALLRRGDDYLLMQRAPNREVAPGVWSGVGGKFERDELNDPLSACLREVYEETGIAAEQIHNLALRYVIIRRHKNTIRQSYVYIGETTAAPSVETDEGKLHWVNAKELLNRTFTATYSAMFRHFVTTPNDKNVVVGVAENDGGKCRMAWSTLQDFDNI